MRIKRRLLDAHLTGSRFLFGLGAADRVDSILVTWPDDGSREEFEGGAADGLRVLRKGEGHTP